ncbi:unnamed protein product [Rhodiola kirilowii]
MQDHSTTLVPPICPFKWCLLSPLNNQAWPNILDYLLLAGHMWTFVRTTKAITARYVL